MPNTISIPYTPCATIRKFHEASNNETAFVRGIMGPIGSGKSVGMCFEVIQRAMQQKPYKGVRRSRWVVIRNTYRELVDTTIKTWLDWFPIHLGIWSQQNLSHIITQHLDDGSVVHLEVLFRALDRPNDVKKLLSLDLTGGWINEAREIPKAIVDMLQGRVGRYPSKSLGGPSWWGVIMDTNPCDDDHWWYKSFEEIKPSNWLGFRQPSGLSTKAENKQNLPPNYYENMIPGKTQMWVDVYVHGQYGFVQDGKIIYPEYQDDIHYSDKPYTINNKKPIYIGIDFGLTPAAVFGQQSVTGQWNLFDELVAEDMGADTFSKELARLIRNKYPKNEFEIYGDPAGEQRSQVDEMTPFMIMSKNGVNAWPASTNDFTLRREAIATNLLKLDFSGQPAFILRPGAIKLRKAMAGGYRYRRLQISGEERYHDVPDKNKYSHVAEAAQYLFVGAGEANTVIHQPDWNKSQINKQIDLSII